MQYQVYKNKIKKYYQMMSLLNNRKKKKKFNNFLKNIKLYHSVLHHQKVDKILIKLTYLKLILKIIILNYG
jgi:hypothetical protein